VNLFPGAPVRLIDPFGADGGPDLVGRALAGPLVNRWGEPVTVVNLPGAGSTAAPALVKDSAADGRTVLLSTSAHAYAGAFWLDLPYDPVEDFTPVAPLTNQPYVLVREATLESRTSPSSSRWDALDRVPSGMARPARARHRTSGWSFSRNSWRSMRHMPQRRPRRGSPNDRAHPAGETDLMIAPIAITLPHLDDGRLVPLGVTTSRRSRVIADVITLSEAGPPGFRFDFPIWYGTWVSSKTPPHTVHILAEAIASALTDPEFQKWLIQHDGDPLAMSQSEFARFVRGEAQMAARIAAAG
jgi:tripartite-type tricarboxylate transporter receptor subunit TctC